MAMAGNYMASSVRGLHSAASTPLSIPPDAMTRTQNRQQRAKLLAQQRRDASAALVAAGACERGGPEHLAALERCAEVLRSGLYITATKQQLQQLAKEFPELQPHSGENPLSGAGAPETEGQLRQSSSELPWLRQLPLSNSIRRTSE